MSEELKTIIDFIRYGASRFAAAGLSFGHGYDNAMDEATQLTLHALHLPHDLQPAYGQARLVADEKKTVLELFERRIRERKPACYLTGEAWFAELSFKCDERALVPRSPIAELIEHGYEPWRNGRPLNRVLDLCTGGGCIAIASAHYLPDAQVDGVDISEAALSLARENAERLLVADRVRLLHSDLYSAVEGETYDLIVTNPPYVTHAEVDALPDEDGFLICEVGEAERALVELLPQVPFNWIEFKVGQMGIFQIEREDLLTWHREIALLAAERRGA